MTYLVVCFCNLHHFVILMIERCFASIYSPEIARVGRFVSSNILPCSMLKIREKILTYVKGREGGKRARVSPWVGLRGGMHLDHVTLRLYWHCHS